MNQYKSIIDRGEGFEGCYRYFRANSHRKNKHSGDHCMPELKTVMNKYREHLLRQGISIEESEWTRVP